MLVSRVSSVNYRNIVPTRVSTKRTASNVSFGKITPEESAELSRLFRVFPGLMHLGDRVMKSLERVVIKTSEGIENAAEGFSEEASSIRDAMLRKLIDRGHQKENWMYRRNLSPTVGRLHMHKAKAA